MADSWQRKRQPDEVPTPLAVAVSDYCRRARVQPSAVEVREALSTLSELDDFRVRQLTDGEPEATPLGPFAVVDIVQGARPDQAARRQEVGYYELARALAAERAQPAPAPSQEVPTIASAQTQHEQLAAKLTGLLGAGEAQRQEKTRRQKAEPGPTVSEKIAPRKRAGGTIPTNAAQDRELELDERPQPRGRFTRIEAPKESLPALSHADARPMLETLIEQHPTRISLLKTLSTRYAGKRGPLELSELMAALDRHGLAHPLEAREHEKVLATVTEHRGAMGRASWELNLTQGELRTLIDDAGLRQKVEDVRERFRREALDPKNLKLRLDLAARTKYLDDLGIRRKFNERLSGDLRGLFKETLPDASNLDRLIDLTAQRQGVDPSSLRRAVEKLDLTDTLSKQLAGHAAASPH